MDIVYRLQGIEFEWDEDKARSNVQKHGITFEEAAEVFFDPFHHTGDASTDDEHREFIIGYLALSTHLVGCLHSARRTEAYHFCAPRYQP